MTLFEAMQAVERRLGLVVNLEVRHPILSECDSLQLPPAGYRHHSEFCSARKLSPGGLMKCAANKERSCTVAAQGRPFYGRCPAGVWDYARPVCYQEELIGIFYLGTPRPAEYPGVPLAEIRHCSDFLAEFIRLELERCRASLASARRKRDDAYYLDQTARYLERAYHRAPSLAELAKLLRVNSNYLGGVLQRASGKTFRQQLTEFRLREAVLQLEAFGSDRTISEIGWRCGFRDSNYFSTVFRKAFGCSPRNYRQLHQKSI